MCRITGWVLPDISRKRGGLNLKGWTSNEETEHSARKDEAITVSKRRVACTQWDGTLRRKNWDLQWNLLWN
jgi:hypothetical protein